MENITCYEKLVKSVNTEKSVLVSNYHSMRMSSFLRAIDSFSSALKKLGFNKDDILTLYLPTCYQSLIAFYACSKIGVIASFVHPLTPVNKLKQNLLATKSKGLLYYDALIKNARCFDDTNQIMIRCSVADYVLFRKPAFAFYSVLVSKKGKNDLKFKKLINKNKENLCDITGRGEDTVCVMHSGGTSGTPKLVRLSNNAINGVALALDNFATADIGHEYALVALPVFHAYGLAAAVHTCLVKNFNLLLQPSFNAKKLNRLIKQYNVTMFIGVPTMYKKMFESSNFEGPHLKKLKHLWCGGDSISSAFVECFNTVLIQNGSSAQLMPGYGLTEACGVVTANTEANYNKKSCGKAIPNTTIEIWDDNEKPVPAKTIGEIAISSPCIMKGYIGEESGVTHKNGEEWIKTGDMGYIDDDGFIFIVDRKKRAIKINSINIFPSEIENLVLKKEYVDEVVAISYRDRQRILFKLVIKLHDGVTPSEKLAEDIKNYCRENLIKYAVPKEVKFVAMIPKTNLGKIDYRQAERM